MPDCVLPPPWCKSKGKLRKTGYIERPFADARLMYNPVWGRWWLAMPRDKANSIYDLWGNWEHPIDREEDVIPKAEALYKKLVRVGWVQDQTGFGPDRLYAVMRVGRGPEMPDYFLKAFDRENLKRGKAIVSGRLRVAGIDVHVDKPSLGGAFGLEARKSVSFTQAELSPKHASGVKISVDRDEAQALSDYFGLLAADTLTDEAWQAIGQSRSNASHKALDVHRDGHTTPDMQERNREIGRCMDAVALNMARLDLDELRMLRLISEVLVHGDAVAGLHVTTRGRANEQGVDIVVDPDTRMAAMSSEERAAMLDQGQPTREPEGPEVLGDQGGLH